MAVKKRKYGVEAGLNTYVSYKTLVPIEHLETIGKKDNHPYHIYAILAFDEFYFDKEKIHQTHEGISFTIFTEDSSGRREYTIRSIPITKGIDHTKVRIELVYPYTCLKMIIEDENCPREDLKNIPINLTAIDLFQLAGEQCNDKTDYEVLYIGQAYGNDGERTAIHRLSAHKTLQKILSEAKISYPTKHFFVLLMQISDSLNLLFDGRQKDYLMDENSCEKHYKDVVCNLPIEKQVINITEAAMIHYFKPVYNERLVNNFPNPNSKSYRQYFDLDYNALTVELDMEFDTGPRVCLYTKSARINSVFDSIRYTLFNDENRLSMYDIFQ